MRNNILIAFVDPLRNVGSIEYEAFRYTSLQTLTFPGYKESVHINIIFLLFP